MMSVIRTAAQHGAGAIDYLAARARSPDPGLAIFFGSSDVSGGALTSGFAATGPGLLGFCL